MSLLQEALDACAALNRRVEHLEYDKVAQALEITKLKRREDEPTAVQEVVDVVNTAKLIIEVVTAASETIAAASTIIFAVEPQVTTAIITASLVRVAAASTRRRKGVVYVFLLEDLSCVMKIKSRLVILHHFENEGGLYDVDLSGLCHEDGLKLMYAMVMKPFLIIVYLYKMALWFCLTLMEIPMRFTLFFLIQVFSYMGFLGKEGLSPAKQKMMLLDSVAEGTLMLLSQVKTVKDKVILLKQE
nr:hypothetical protein [Tanacetum cinerariifolium]